MGDDPVAAPDFLIRRLTQADVHLYRRLRLEALRLHPEAFASDFDSESQMSTADFAARMPSPPGGLFGGFAGSDEGAELAGIAGLVVQPRAKLCHKGQLVGMYVTQRHRRAGLARALVQHVTDQARSAHLHSLLLAVTAGNEPARRLYTQLGFHPYGIERDALCVDGRFYDEELMALRLA